MGDQIFTGVWKEGSRLNTKNGGNEVWDPYSSKPAAAIMRGLKNFPVCEGQKILYLGAAHGTTISHFSNIVGEKGIIYGVEVSGKVIAELLKKSEKKKNIVPLLEDARFPENYGWVGLVDLVYEDIAQKDQVSILKRNSVLLKPGGFAVIALKAKAIDSVKDTREIYREALEEMTESFDLIETIELDPFERDHLFIVGKLK